MTKNVTSDDLYDHYNYFFLSHIKWHIKWKETTPVIDLSMYKTNWRSFELNMTKTVTSDHDHNNVFFLSHIKWHNYSSSWSFTV